MSGLLAALLLATVGMTVTAQPASAGIEVRFSLNEVAGRVTFYNGYSYKIQATVYNPYTNGSVSYNSWGGYSGQGFYVCVKTPTRYNHVFDAVRTWSDSATCWTANIETVLIREFHSEELADYVYLDNPYVPD